MRGTTGEGTAAQGLLDALPEAAGAAPAVAAPPVGPLTPPTAAPAGAAPLEPAALGPAAAGGRDGRDGHGHPAVAATSRALADLGATGRVVLLPADVRGPARVALHLGVPAGAVARSTLLRAPDGHPLLVLASSAHDLCAPLLAAVLGLPGLEEAGEAESVRRTGSVLGSASPLGLAEPLPTYVDVTLALHRVVWVPAGHPRALFPTRYDELLRMACAHPVETG
ncbi:aminoacyl-tRNA deacylase [Kineococcus gypseus]|uniref:aminoacyl-tRNA deacylase n=1 Tax=Kineococcus gypseus TaxID=1637102 RepID=UPI003D7D64CE